MTGLQLATGQPMRGTAKLTRDCRGLTFFSLFMLFAWSGDVSAAPLNSEAENPVDTRDFYVPGYKTTSTVDFQLGEIRGRAGDVEGYRSVPTIQGEELIGAAKAHAIAQLDTIERLCLTAARGPNGEFTGFQELTPDRLLTLTSLTGHGSGQTLLFGHTSYVGPEDQDPGEFSCLVRGPSVISWIFYAESKRAHH